MVSSQIYIDDVYAELMKYEEMGKFVILRYKDQSIKRKDELTDFIAGVIIDEKFYYNDLPQKEFMKRFFNDAWMRAIAINNK